MFGSFGWMELLLILVIVLIIFGAGKIPQLGDTVMRDRALSISRDARTRASLPCKSRERL